MPAETHQRFARADPDRLIDFVIDLVAPGAAERPHRHVALAAVGLANEALRWALWDAIVEEFGERGSAEADDPDDLLSAQNVGELVDVFENWLGWASSTP